jgi:hypothetical protein
MYNLKVYKFIRDTDGFENFDFEILLEVEVESRKELRLKYESKFQLYFKPSLNSQTEGRDIKEIKKQYYKDNKEKFKEYYKDNKEKIKEYYKDNKEKYNEYAVKNKEKIKEKKKEYYKDNKEKKKNTTKIIKKK